MVRKYKRKTSPVDEETMKSAVRAVRRDKVSVRSAAKLYKVNYATLDNWLKKTNEVEASNDHDQVKALTVGRKTMFSPDAELTLTNYLKTSSDMYFGLTPKQFRGLAYDFGNKLKVQMPLSWDRSRMAGIEWLRCFLERSKDLSVRKPQATSLARATAFNRENVGSFFAKLKSVMNEQRFSPQNIYNMDETGVTTVQIPDRVISRKGVKQVGRVVSAERGTLVTLAVAVSATGNLIPPFFVFPRKKFKPHFLFGGPVGCAGTGNQSGWMNAEGFYEFLKFFQSHAHSSPDNPVLLILDNHDSHLSIRGLDFCKENGITVLSLPPHTSHKLQPLDRSVFAPFKKLVNTACDNWITNNPGTTMNIYHIPYIITKSLPLAASNSNIISGFVCTGIYPLNENIFQEYEYMPSVVTDRPLPSTSTAVLDSDESSMNVAAFEEVSSSSSNSAEIQSQNEEWINLSENSASSLELLNSTLETIRPYPKAPPRKVTKRGRKKRKSEILTSSPVMKSLREEQTAAAIKKAAKEAKSNRARLDTKSKPAKPAKPVNNTLTHSEICAEIK